MNDELTTWLASTWIAFMIGFLTGWVDEKIGVSSEIKYQIQSFWRRASAKNKKM